MLLSAPPVPPGCRGAGTPDARGGWQGRTQLSVPWRGDCRASDDHTAKHTALVSLLELYLAHSLEPVSCCRHRCVHIFNIYIKGYLTVKYIPLSLSRGTGRVSHREHGSAEEMSPRLGAPATPGRKHNRCSDLRACPGAAEARSSPVTAAQPAGSGLAPHSAGTSYLKMTLKSRPPSRSASQEFLMTASFRHSQRRAA